MPILLLPDPRTIPSPDEPGSGPCGTSRRRAFLAGLAAGGASMTFGVSARAAGPTEPNPWYALVADTHIAADPSERARGEVMADNLRAVVADILEAGTPPSGVLIDGDLALTDGRAGDYRTLVSLLEPIRAARVPIHLALGNHDDRENFRAGLKGAVPLETQVVDKQVGEVEAPGLRLLVLDSLDRVNVTPGRLGAGQLDWLARRLDARPDVPALVFVHHNPTPRGASGLIDAEALLGVLRPRRQAKAVVFGHTHVWKVHQEDGLYLINLPAVAYPFASGQPLAWCRFSPSAEGGTLELRCVGGDRRDDHRTTALRWRGI